MFHNDKYIPVTEKKIFVNFVIFFNQVNGPLLGPQTKMFFENIYETKNVFFDSKDILLK